MLAEAVKKQTMTAEKLVSLSPEARRGELIQGEFISMSPAGFMHGRIALKIGTYLNIFVLENHLGAAYAAETGFVLKRNPDTVRAPDVAFVTAEHAAKQSKETGFFEGAPDLAVEVISPSETMADIESKLFDYLEAGTQVVWLVFPRTQSITVYRSLTDIRIFTIEDSIDCSELLPGFSVTVEEIFS
ncbi:MAG: Uma2 family endonuclease [Aquificales bacterium]|nr:Uma2 family endonuclease [Aquificales bacterium]